MCHLALSRPRRETKKDWPAGNFPRSPLGFLTAQTPTLVPGGSAPGGTVRAALALPALMVNEAPFAPTVVVKGIPKTPDGVPDGSRTVVDVVGGVVVAELGAVVVVVGGCSFGRPTPAEPCRGAYP